jgi:hypothetical protein
MSYRQSTVSFMRQHRDDFEPYMEDGEDFDRYCSRMAQVWRMYLPHSSIRAAAGFQCMAFGLSYHLPFCLSHISMSSFLLHCRTAHGQGSKSRWLWLASMVS